MEEEDFGSGQYMITMSVPPLNFSDLPTLILSNTLLGRFLFFISTNVSPYHRFHHPSSPQASHTGHTRFTLMLSRLPKLEHIHQASQAAASSS